VVLAVATLELVPAAVVFTYNFANTLLATSLQSTELAVTFVRLEPSPLNFVA
jgi:hypothetical protein